MNIKTLSEWETGNHGNFDEYVKINDVVDEEMALYFAEVVAGGFIDNKFAQCGEASDYSSIGGYVYTTFERIENTDTWKYIGDKLKIEDRIY